MSEKKFNKILCHFSNFTDVCQLHCWLLLWHTESTSTCKCNDN